MQRLLIILTIFLMPASIFAQKKLAQLSIVGAPEKIENEICTRMDLNGKYCAVIKIVSDLQRFRYDSNNGVEKVDHEPGRDQVYLQANERVLEIMHDGYEPLKIILVEAGIDLKPKEVWQLKITGEKKLIEIPTTIVVKPEGAKILIDGKDMGAGPSFKITAGKHKISVSLDETYETVDDEIEVSLDNSYFPFELKKRTTAIITISSEPTGAEIYLNTQYSGVTPYQGKILTGAYTLELRKPPLYLPLRENIIIESDKTNEYKFRLILNSGYLKISSNPPGAAISLNGKIVGSTDTQIGPIDKGTYTIHLEKELYHPLDAQVLVEIDKVNPYSFELKPAFGTLKIDSKPSLVDLSINGQPMGKTPYNNSQAVSGSYMITLKKELYGEVNESIIVQDGLITEKVFTLSEKFGELNIESKPTNAEIYLDGKFFGKTPYQNKQMASGEYNMTFKMKLYGDVPKKIIVKDRQKTDETILLPARFGTLKIGSKPSDAEIYLGSELIGRTPYVNEQMPSGEYIITVKKKLFGDVTKKYIIRDGVATDELIELPANFGKVRINTLEQAEISIDGKLIGKGKKEVDLLAGFHEFEAQLGKHNPAKESRNIRVGTETSINLSPEPRYGSLSVIVKPYEARNAEIYIDGEFKGNAPKIFKDIFEGRHTIVIKKKDYLDNQPITVTVNYQKETEQEITLSTYIGDILARRATWNSRRNWTFLSAIVWGGASLGCKYLSDDAYDQYKKATTVKKADSWRVTVRQYELGTKVALGGTGLFAVWTLYNQIRKSRIKVPESNKYSLEFDPAQGRMNLCVRF